MKLENDVDIKDVEKYFFFLIEHSQRKPIRALLLEGIFQIYMVAYCIEFLFFHVYDRFVGTKWLITIFEY